MIVFLLSTNSHVPVHASKSETYKTMHYNNRYRQCTWTICITRIQVLVGEVLTDWLVLHMKEMVLNMFQVTFNSTQSKDNTCIKQLRPSKSSTILKEIGRKTDHYLILLWN